jgi:hypothetical protein
MASAVQQLRHVQRLGVSSGISGERLKVPEWGKGEASLNWLDDAWRSRLRGLGREARYSPIHRVDGDNEASRTRTQVRFLVERDGGR